MKNIVIDDAMLDKWANEYHFCYTLKGLPLNQVYTFEQYVEMKKEA